MKPLNLGILLFDQFELLDVCGPIEMFANLPNLFNILLISEKKGLIQSAQNVSMLTNYDFNDSLSLEIILVPGGNGTRHEINNQKLLSWLKFQTAKTKLILSVCTGAALLAKAGILDNHKATSNKIAFDWVKRQGPSVHWVDQARWVEDGNIITSSGVAAGIDMSLFAIARLFGQETAQLIANNTEYLWNQDSSYDPFYRSNLP